MPWMDYEESRLERKNVILRLDLDGSFRKGHFQVPEKISRYRSLLDTLAYRKAKTVILFELGVERVKSPWKAPIKEAASYFCQLLNRELTYFEGKPEKDLDYALEEILPGEFLICENLALTGEEDLMDSVFFKKLENWGDLFLEEAFSLISENRYSTRVLPQKMPWTYGPAALKEHKKFQDFLSRSEDSSVLILGGLDLDDSRVEELLWLSEKMDFILLTGAWVSYYARQIAEIEREDWMNKRVGRFFDRYFPQMLEKTNILFPQDVKVYKKYADGTRKIANIPIDFIRKDLKIGDIGREALEHYKNILSKAKNVFWLGSVGKWWKEGLGNGTLELGTLLSRSYSQRVFVAGDDLLESFHSLGLDSGKFTLAHYGSGETLLKTLCHEKIPVPGEEVPNAPHEKIQRFFPLI